MSFYKLLNIRWQKKLFLCIGLDPDYEKIPEFINKSVSSSRSRSNNKTPELTLRVRLWRTRSKSRLNNNSLVGISKNNNISQTIFSFNQQIIDNTFDLVNSYKPNLSFYIMQGDDGVLALSKTIAYVHKNYPGIPVILDAKFCDIKNTNIGYAKFAFEYLKADAVTVNPYLGKEAIEPFLNYKDKGIFIIVKTSNPKAGEIQDVEIVDKKLGKIPLYQLIAARVANYWNSNGNCGLVVGATYPKDLKTIRKIAPNLPILIPGIGAQAGDLEKSVESGLDKKGQGILISVSRSIIFAGNDKDFSQKARIQAEKLNQKIINYI